MILFTAEDQQMLSHMVDVITDQILACVTGYTEEDEATVAKVKALSEQPTSTLIVEDGDREPTKLHHIFKAVVEAELDHWAPDASQQLLHRAARALGFAQPDPSHAQPDCGNAVHAHSWINDWVAGTYLMRCSSCYRLRRR